MSKQIERAVEKSIRDADIDIIGEQGGRGSPSGEGLACDFEGWYGHFVKCLIPHAVMLILICVFMVHGEM